MTALCPKCAQTAGSLTVESIRASYPGTTQFRTFVFLCPKCSTIVGVAIDPTAAKASGDIALKGAAIGRN